MMRPASAEDKAYSWPVEALCTRVEGVVTFSILDIGITWPVALFFPTSSLFNTS